MPVRLGAIIAQLLRLACTSSCYSIRYVTVSSAASQTSTDAEAHAEGQGWHRRLSSHQHGVFLQLLEGEGALSHSKRSSLAGVGQPLSGSAAPTRRW